MWLLNKIIFLTFILFYYSVISFAQESHQSDSLNYARITFEKTDFDFGDMKQGEKAAHVFQFRNTGNLPLILNNVLSTCGCTVPEWPRIPVYPDSLGQIKVVFDSKSKIGRQNKVITIRSNSRGGDFRLRVAAMVLPPENGEKGN
ncbi:MAG: DUF1573 domain-containing protein [Cytophagales bacterium]|nr:DUF1573 domain-containing protein [Cytophagales bacterium]